jgi:tetrapyrrole methylase family protein/MazG family protein
MKREGASFRQLVELMDALRGEKGCPWDKEQTLESLKPFLIEEAYEVIEAIDRNDPEKLREELGDLLFHIVFVSKVSAETGEFCIEDVISGAHQKMTRRHPHVFGPQGGEDTVEAGFGGGRKAQRSGADRVLREGTTLGNVSSRESAHVLKQWYEIKQEERAKKGLTSVMDGIPSHLPALQKAQKVQRRAAQVGFDWEKVQDVFDKIGEEMREVREAISRQDPHRVSEELGDLLFSVVNVCRFLKVDAEGSLRAAVAKFTGRFRAMEAEAAASGKTLSDLTLEEMDALWDQSKAEEGQDSACGG